MKTIWSQKRLFEPFSFRLYFVTLLTSLLRQSEGKIRMKESQIFKIKIPPKQFQLLEGKEFVSTAEKFKQSLMNLGRGDLESLLSESAGISDKESEIINIATQFLSNGRPIKVEKKNINDYNSSTHLPTAATTTAYPVINSPSETETSTLPWSTYSQIPSIKTSKTTIKSTATPSQLLTRFPQSAQIMPQQLISPLSLYQHPTFLIPYHVPTYPRVPIARHKKFIIPASTTLLRRDDYKNVFSHFNPFPTLRYPHPFYG